MAERTDNETTPPKRRETPRRLLLVSGGGGGEQLKDKIASGGFEVVVAPPDSARRLVAETSPSAVLIAFGGRETEDGLLTLARRLRAEPATFGLPLVFLFGADGRTLRSAALHLGADDYFAQSTPRAEVRARLDALFWRAEAGRRAAPAVAEQRSEIDNFIFLLDAVAADAGRGLRGALALVEAVAETGAGASEAERALAAAHGFLKLNLRRVDAVAFYGPNALLVYLPGADPRDAQATLARLREEFLAANPGRDLLAGLASFPADGVEVERLIEKAELALDAARARNSPAHVLIYREGVAPAESGQTPEVRVSALGGAGWGAPGEARQAAAREAGLPSAPGLATPLTVRKESLAGDGQSAASRAGAQQTEHRARSPFKSRRALLVVSDAARMAQINLLMRSAGYEVRAAFDGHHALNLLRIDRPDLLVVDYELHGMDGVEMLRRLGKQTGGGTQPPALMFLPAGRESLRGEAFEAGARGVINLPYDPVELLDTLRRVGGTE